MISNEKETWSPVKVRSIQKTPSLYEYSRKTESIRMDYI